MKNFIFLWGIVAVILVVGCKWLGESGVRKKKNGKNCLRNWLLGAVHCLR